MTSGAYLSLSLAYIKTESDVLKFVNALIANTKGEGKEGDPFWTKAETLLYCALIAYIIFEGPDEDKNMNTLVDMISGMEVKEDDDDFMNAVDYMFAGLEKRKPDCFAVKQYKKYKLASGKTARSILISCGARLAPFDIPQLREIMSYDEMELDKLGDRRTAAFFIISDTDTTYNFIVALGHFVPKCHLPPIPGGFSCARENPGEMEDYMAFFASAITTLQTLVIALGAGLGVWGVVNLLEGYGSDNPGSKSQGMKHLIPKLM